MKLRFTALALPLVLAVACDKQPAAPDVSTTSNVPQMQQIRRGTGLALESVTGLELPLIGQAGNVVINQAVITNFTLIENTVGQIVGLQAEGVLQLTGTALGTGVTENFVTTAAVTSSGFGRCDIVTIDLGPINIDRLPGVQVDIPAATLTGRGSGAVGPLLCALGQMLNPVTRGVRAVVRVLNLLI
jgi:hypothetical protein